jgi:DNA-binding winged helix-turn-helix (wHTH) protein/Flp pilus assembly protein TadD
MNAHSYWFGPFRLDVDRRALFQGATCRPLSERLFQLLLALIEADGNVVSRDDLAHRVWGAEGVTDTNLTQHVYLLRELLGERRGERAYVLTVSGSGYRFATAVTPVPSDGGDFLVERSARDAGAPSSMEALQNFCRGNYLLDRRTAPSLRAAIGAFGRAIKADERFVDAYVGLARAWAMLAEYWHEPAPVAMPKARAYVDRALELDSRSGMALAALSEIQLCAEWNWATSRRSLESALMAEPNSAFARNNAAWYHLYRGEFDRAALEAREALQTQPASLPLQLLNARVLTHAGNYDQAITAIGELLAMDPGFSFARRFLTTALLLAGHPDRALQEIASESPDDDEDAVYRLPLLTRAWSKLGESENALQAYERLRALSRTRYVSAWNLAMSAANCGREEEALGLLRVAERQRDSALLLLPLLMPIFDALEDRSDFSQLVRSAAA